MDRRQFCQNTFLASLAALASGVTSSSTNPSRFLILVELTGANDGLNTLVPFKNDRYYALRPEIGIPRKDILPLDEHQGFHPALAGFRSLYEAGDLRVFQNVGYPDQIQSHFRSIEIWERGGDGKANGREGWLVTQLSQVGVDRFDAPGIYLGGTGNIFAGGQNFLGPHSVREMLLNSGAPNSTASAKSVPKSALLSSIQRSQASHDRRVSSIVSKLRADKSIFSIRGRQLGTQLTTVCTLISAGVDIPVFKVTIGSFDTHVNQRNQHRDLLRELDQAIVDTISCLKRIGVWHRTAILTYSEFGRRAAENGSRGTDHGTAAPHFLLGGNINGGIHGGMADLENLRNGDLVFGTDYRSVFEFVLRHHMNIGDNIFREFREIEA